MREYFLRTFIVAEKYRILFYEYLLGDDLAFDMNERWYRLPFGVLCVSAR